MADDPTGINDAAWDKVHELLEPWQKVWNGDRAQYDGQHPSWILDAAAELFAHDLCDAWDWNDYVKAASVIIERHYASSTELADLRRQLADEKGQAEHWAAACQEQQLRAEYAERQLAEKDTQIAALQTVVGKIREILK